MTSSGESLLLYFHSDSSSQKDGFTLTVTLLSPYDLSQGSFSGIPGVYDYNNGSPITVSYTVLNIMGNAVSPGNYNATIDGQNTTTVSTLGDHTLTVTGKDPYFGTLTKTFKVMQALSGEGTQDNPYLINNNGDWEGFATRVNNGETYRMPRR